jgi:hypothetical protein
MKEILGVHCKTPNAAYRFELARKPCRTKIITACIKYLDHVISLNFDLADFGHIFSVGSD